MLARSTTVAFVGSEARRVDVEVHVFTSGLPGLTIVGLAGRPIREAEQRIRSALECSEPEWPNRKIVANLAPSGLRKDGTHLDLALALGILAGGKTIPAASLDGWIVVGELGLDGSLRAVAGVLPAAIAAREQGMKGIICPSANAAEAAIVGAIEVAGIDKLDDTVAFLRGEFEPEPPRRADPGPRTLLPDLADVKGHRGAKRALEIAAAGGHNLLMSGPPGCGKTMLATRLAGILPPMTEPEALEVSRIHSIAGFLTERGDLITERPLRAPHHHVSLAGLIGGGAGLAKPGEVTLAHRGTLFLDELPLFPRHVLDSLRAPMEEGRVRIARSGGTVSFPCSFALLGALNPCPCGFHLDATRPCRCDLGDRARYLRRLSGPLLDRFDLFVGMTRPTRAELLGPSDGEASVAVRARVEAARRAQADRFGDGVTNAAVSREMMRAALTLEPGAAALLASALDGALLSARGFDKVLRVALTIADLAGRQSVGEDELAEAISLRVALPEIGGAP